MADRYAHKSVCDSEMSWKIVQLNEIVDSLNAKKNNMGVENSDHLFTMQDEFKAIIRKIENDIIPHIESQRAKLKGE